MKHKQTTIKRPKNYFASSFKKRDFAKKKIAKICMASGKMMPLFVNMKEKESHAFSCLASKVAISNTKKCAKNTTTLEGSPGP